MSVNSVNDDLMLSAIKKWDETLQINLCQEECGELITAIAHFRRKIPSCFEKLVEEIADVTIVSRQMALMVGEERVNQVILQKQERLALRLSESRFEDTPTKDGNG